MNNSKETRLIEAMNGFNKVSEENQFFILGVIRGMEIARAQQQKKGA